MAAQFRELLIWLATGSTGDTGSALSVLHSTLIWAILPILSLVYRRYVGFLGFGSEPQGTRERQAYDALRNNLAGDNLAARLYAQWLTSVLGRVDRFFGDAGMANCTLFPHAFGLTTPAPLWTAPAFELCLLLALIYPMATIFIIWAISGHVGPAELALHLDPGLQWWQRCLAAALALLSVFALWAAARMGAWRRVISIIFSIVAFVVAMILSVASAQAMAIAGATSVASAGYFIKAQFMLRSYVPMSIAHRAITAAVVLLGTITVTATIAVLGGVLGAIRRSSQLGGRRWEGIFLSFIFVAMIFACYSAAIWLSSLQVWQILGPLLLFLGLLTLLNALFDWGSLGLTRALLRRGLELGGWWPYGLALVDAGLAAIIIAVLTLVMVIGVQAFDELAVHGGGTAILPLTTLFAGVAAHPRAPEYWWIYALLLSTMIPSLTNLVIGGTSLLRGAPGLPALLLRFIPAQGNVLKPDRAWIAAVLTIQVAAGAVLGLAAQGFLVLVIIGHIMPFFGLELLGMARDVAAFNVPMRTGQLFGYLL